EILLAYATYVSVGGLGAAAAGMEAAGFGLRTAAIAEGAVLKGFFKYEDAALAVEFGNSRRSTTDNLKSAGAEVACEFVFGVIRLGGSRLIASKGKRLLFSFVVSAFRGGLEVPKSTLDGKSLTEGMVQGTVKAANPALTHALRIVLPPTAAVPIQAV